MLKRILNLLTSKPIDPFRPAFEPAGYIYDALTEEMKKRDIGRRFDECIESERRAVLNAVKRLCGSNNYNQVTIEELEEIEQSALGSDYASKYARRVGERMTRSRSKS